jgi:hypothetical protein
VGLRLLQRQWLRCDQGRGENHARRSLARMVRTIDLLERDDFSSNRHLALSCSWSMIFSDLPSPAEAPSCSSRYRLGFAQAGNRYPPLVKPGAGIFGIML